MSPVNPTTGVRDAHVGDTSTSTTINPSFCQNFWPIFSTYPTVGVEPPWNRVTTPMLSTTTIVSYSTANWTIHSLPTEPLSNNKCKQSRTTINVVHIDWRIWHVQDYAWSRRWYVSDLVAWALSSSTRNFRNWRCQAIENLCSYVRKTEKCLSSSAPKT